MKHRTGLFLWVESVLALVIGVAGVLTLVWPQWVEAILKFDPDDGNGSYEWSLVVALLLAAMVLGRVAKRQGTAPRNAADQISVNQAI